ncbi:phenylalanine--tRNA ligase subunit beta [Chitinophaga deserti]|uniref:phenylalanine--tRNA ligase subunit beta n=1 Tax=Chitinophaga deserti TaxID=2164099 RepID=UPI000D6DB803|nr:phenylalanine--tRNA ligase subunit beta [Chitinophaga deserti]
MTISYNWLCDYLPVKPVPEELSVILTAIGLEVESLERFESIKGSLEGLVIGEVLTVEKHPNADKLRLTTVNTGNGAPLAIVCGAPNVAAGQKVVVAPVGTTIYPASGEPLTMKKAKIRGEDSFGMICAEDEIGLGSGHDGILVLDASLQPGTPAREVFQPYQDWIFEIGLTPNHMDAMSHMGVARDVCAFLNNRENTQVYHVRKPGISAAAKAAKPLPIAVEVKNTDACPRYCGQSITGVKVGPSPLWMQHRLLAIGVRPINNIVDITNYVLHETGQPLHAFDAATIKGGKIVVENLPAGTSFISLDGKERKLDAGDLMICDGEDNGLCIAGVFGGLGSGVKEATTDIFLESAYFNATSIRKTSVRHGLRTDAAIRFEKGLDISLAPFALERAVALIGELAHGAPASDLTDVYPAPVQPFQIDVTYDYIRTLSGHQYPEAQIKNILCSLGFTIHEESGNRLRVAAPLHKPDITIPADIVEEVMRIDGLDNIPIPALVSMAPSVQAQPDKERVKERIADYLAGNGFSEIFTNSITNAQYYSHLDADTLVKMLNSLSADLNVLRPSMLETGLERIAYNLNRRNDDLLFFEFGKTYRQEAVGQYPESAHLTLYLTGRKLPENWMQKEKPVDFYDLKGYIGNILQMLGLQAPQMTATTVHGLQPAFEITSAGKTIAVAGNVAPAQLKAFDIKQPVWYADFNWDVILSLLPTKDAFYEEIPRFPSVRRDLALVLDKSVPFAAVETAARSVKTNLLQQINLFDVFESDKLGAGKKSYAVSFTFQDKEKTLTDQETDTLVNKLVKAFESQLQAEIRK